MALAPSRAQAALPSSVTIERTRRIEVFSSPGNFAGDQSVFKVSGGEYDGQMAYCYELGVPLGANDADIGAQVTFHDVRSAGRVLSYILTHGANNLQSSFSCRGLNASGDDAILATSAAVHMAEGVIDRECTVTSSKNSFLKDNHGKVLPVYAHANPIVRQIAKALYEEALAHEGDESISADGALIVSDGQGSMQDCVVFCGLGKASLTKRSTNPDMTDNNPCYGVDGAEYGIYASAADASADTNRLTTLTVGGEGASPSVSLAAGTYFAREIKAPQGYALDKSVHTVDVQPGQDATLDVSDTPQSDSFGVRIRKVDEETTASWPQGDASFEGAQYLVSYYAGFFDSLASLPSTPTRSWTLKTDKDGKTSLADAQSNPSVYLESGDAFYRNSSGTACLPLGTVTIQETKPPTGYLLPTDSTPQLTVIRSAGEDENVSVMKETVIADPVQRAGVSVQKRDLQSDLTQPEGAASFSDAEITITTRSKNPVLVEGTLYDPGQVVKRIYTDERGLAQSAADLLPEGTYELVETKAPKGYLLNKTWKKTVVVRQDGRIYEVVDKAGKLNMAGESETSGVPDQVKRGDIHFNKEAFPTQARMGRVAFLVTSLTTGEHHVAATDENGSWSSAVSWNPHTSYTDDEQRDHVTNANDACLSDDKTNVADEGKLDPLAGFWFYGYATNTEPDPNDNLGALPYDTYEFKELRSMANDGMQLVTFKVTITRHGADLDMGTISDTRPHLTTSLGDEAGNRELASDESIKLVDHVDYEDVLAGKCYTLTMKVWDLTSEGYLTNDKGEVLEARQELCPKESAGSARQELEIDATALAGHTLVAHEFLNDSTGELLAEHADNDDPEQTVRFPQIQTTAQSAMGDSELALSTNAKAQDVVTYKGLQPKGAYRLEGTIHLVEEDGSDAGTLRREDGSEVKTQKDLSPEASDGNTTLEFEIDTTKLAGRTVVVFERLYKGESLVATHEDIGDERQSLRIPGIATNVTGEEEGTICRAAQDATLVDHVSYWNLTPQIEYELVGTLHVRNADGSDAGALRDEAGNELTVRHTFTPSHQDGSEDVTFTYDAGALQGMDVVVFETLMRDGQTYAEHADIDALSQTVSHPHISTIATGPDGTHELAAESVLRVRDTVSYSGLKPGLTYELEGTLVSKQSGEPLVNAQGDDIKALTTFVAEEADGEATVEFELDTRGLEGAGIVAFETLSSGGKVWAEHNDLDDESQTVWVDGPNPEKQQPKKPLAQTGREGVSWLAVTAAALATLGGIAILLLAGRR